MPARRRRCASLAEAAARIEALEIVTEALAARIEVLEDNQGTYFDDQAALLARIRVLEAAQPYTLAG